ncbi:TPA: pantoate--beta-alanine ligase [Candidatus Poribacteria bacterium]|nr:pantoate--beta-alanine ligase [Candidatus Poribacteria bacterium]HEX30087.1 pantoate--beta-alanine ligase [Candidatus Poribacteria bacterium]
MMVLSKPEEVQRHCERVRLQGKRIGFVPTMGYFHEGHLTLMRRAKEENDLLVVSLFVNPTQFGPNEDYERYPRDLDRDRELAEKEGVDLLFVPSVEDMYPAGYATYVEVTGTLTSVLCGARRPGHFRGVTTVVAKLFNIVKPHRAYFGEKDAQQLRVIKRMAKDLNFDVEIISVPTVRESDGLAMSSRNEYLSPEERKAALVLWRSLNLARSLVEAGERKADRIISEMRRLIESEPLAKIDYVEIVDSETLEKVDRIEGEVLVALAVFIGTTRLIDNMIISVS